MLIVVEDGTRAIYRTARTRRALARLGLPTSLVVEAGALADRLARLGPRPLWILRAGAVPRARPRELRRSATGRSLVAVGATHGDPKWEELLARTGGDLGQAALEPGDARIFASVAIEDSTRLSLALAAAPRGDLDAAFARLASDRGVRVVRVPALDVVASPRPHVMEVVTTLHRGGAERIVLDLWRELRHVGWDTSLAVMDRATRSTFDAPPGTLFAATPGAGRRARIDAVIAAALERGVDLLHAHLADGDELRALARSGIPLATTVHNAAPGWPRRLETLAAGDVALAIACSVDVERQLREARTPAPLRTIWNGITPRPRARQPPAAGSPAVRPPSPSRRLRLLTIANHRPQKRLDRLPGIVAELRRRGLDASACIVGEPVFHRAESLAVGAAVLGEAARLGVGEHVVLVPSREDVDGLYDEADVVVSASGHEGLSLVHLEALDRGLPLVTTKVSGTEELAAKGHPRLRVVALEADAAAFADAILQATEEGARPGEAHALASGLAPDFTARRMAERHAELFDRVLARGRSSASRAGTYALRRSAHAAARPRGGIVLVTNNFSTGGAQSSARRLLVALREAGVPVHAVVIQEQEAYPTPGRAALVAAGVPVRIAPRAGAVDPLVTARAVAALVDQVDPAAVFFWNVIPEHKVLIADLLLDVPIHDVSPGEMYFASFARYLRKPRVGLPYLTTADYGRRLAGAVVKYGAEHGRAAEALGVPIAVVPNGVPLGPLRPSRADRAGRAEGRVVVGTLARIGADKRLDQLVEAVRAASGGAGDRGLPPGFELRIAGAPERGEEALAARLVEGSAGLPITWVGEQESASFLAGLDFFAMISEPSGCPNASLEAMAAGLAVVATDVGGASEQIAHRETGILVPRGDVAALGAALVELARDAALREAWGAAARARIAERFALERMASAYAAIAGVPIAAPLDAAPPGFDPTWTNADASELAHDGLGP